MPKSTSKKDFSPIEYDAKRDALARDRLIQARVAMLIRHDFWGKMATRMRLINADAWCPTLATDGRDFYYNSEFVLSLGSIDKVIFGFAHEVLHCIYDHIPRTGDRDRKLSNIAQDYVINADLVHYNVGKAIDEVQIIYDKKYFNWSFEAVYDELIQNAEKIDINALFEQLLDDHIEPDDEGASGDDGDDNQDGVSKRRPRLSKEQKEAIKDEIREALLQAAQSSGAGNLPGGIQRIVNKMTAPKMDWRTLINMKIPSLAKNDYSYQRFNKKYMQSGIIVPGLNRQEAIDVCIAIDTSGSITQKILEEQLSEVAGIMDMYDEFTIRVWQFDTGTYGYAEFTKDTAADLLRYEIKGGGGTSFEVNWKMMKEEGIEPQMLIVFTDGEPFGSWGDDSYCETLWIINNKYNKSIEPPFGAYAYYE